MALDLNLASNVFLVFFIFILGASLGSFLNVVIYRMPRGFSVALPTRSICPSCLTQLNVRWNIPILSYLFLRARCASCQEPISARYPLVELLCAILFLAVTARFGWSWESLKGIFLVLILLPIIFIDIDFYIIPDELNVLGVVLALGFRFCEGTLMEGVAGGICGFLGFYLLAKSYSLIKGADGLGFGDVKMLAMLGCFLGPWGVLVSVAVSSVVGAIIGVTLMLVRGESLKMAIPYGPFLAVGGFFALFWGEWLQL